MTRVTQMSRPLLRPRVGYGNPVPPLKKLLRAILPVDRALNQRGTRPVGKSFLDGDGKLSPIRGAVAKPSPSVALNTGLPPVRWTVDGFRDHWTGTSLRS